MDITKREITKIARHVSRFTALKLRNYELGSSEIDTIHLVRKNPGITVQGLSEKLGLDKAGLARQVKRLVEKGYIERKINSSDKRSSFLYATSKAQEVKESRLSIESSYYQWLLEDLNEEEQKCFCELLEKLYQKSKKENKTDFSQVLK